MDWTVIEGAFRTNGSRRASGVARRAGWLAWLFLLVAGCSGETTPPAAKADVAGDVGLPGDVTGVLGDGASGGCPGGGGCACSLDTECVDGHCFAGADGSLTCAPRCAGLDCAPGLACSQLPAATGTAGFCVFRSPHACEPCNQSSDCAVPGLPGAACVDYGAIGAFCGTPCQGDLQCGAGYHCQAAARVEGGQTQQCVRTGVGASLGECACNAHAIATQASTVCRAPGGSCKGTRACGPDGLSPCSAAAAVPESCNGIDDDCNGLTDEALCDDGQVCTTDSCDPVKGCQHDDTGSACSDGNACTQGDACTAGKCAAGVVVSCDDGSACTVDTCDPGKGCSHAGGSGACSDGDACTFGDVCKGALCLPGTATVCDDKNPCTADACNPASGCAAQAVDGAQCNDGNACTLFDACAGGGCKGAADACDDGNPCTTDACDPKTGCSHAAAAGACDDADPCTTGEACAAGKCAGGNTKQCLAPSDCLTAWCSPVNGQCATKPKLGGTVCSDGSACSGGDTCSGGTCKGQAVDCDDANACTDDLCDGVQGCLHTANLAPCTDGNACTSGDACGAGKCVGQALAAGACDDKNACTDDACDPKAGCVQTAKVTGACDDGNPCTGNDACDKGKCVSGANQCVCTTSADCASQEDGNLCNGTLTCDGGACKVDAATIVACPAGQDNACNKSTCAVATGKCALVATADGTACDDANTCTTADACKSGSCVGGTGPCDDKNPCTDDSCEPLGGCKNVANTAPCAADADLCTVDACAGKVCLPGAAIACDDGNACTADSCDAKTGKCATAPADGGLCDDGDACTVQDACKAGKCEGSLPPSVTSLVAGSGTAGFFDAKGSGAQFALVGQQVADRGALALAADGTLFLADTGNHRIRKVKADGTVSTLAGNGISGFADGAGGLANFWDPSGIVVAPDGTVYVADRLNQRIRKIAVDGATSTLAGDAADPGLDAKAPGGWQDGKGTAALFDEPTGLALDAAGALYVTEAANHRIRKVLPDGTVTTVAGSGNAAFADGKGAAASFKAPLAIAVGANGVLYVADSGNQRIRAIAVDGTVTTIAGSGATGMANGTAANASFNQPWGLTIGSNGGLYIADALNHAVRVLSGGQVASLAGTGAKGYAEGTFAQAQFFEPTGVVAAATGTWYVVDSGNQRLRKLHDPTASCPPK